MRIISGKFKGQTIHFIKNKITRPLKDSVKENIFNLLNHSKKINTNLKNSSVLDLYSGVGSFGLECISRGAKKVIFFENDLNALSILKKNLEKLSAVNQAEIINDSVENINFLLKKQKFDIFFFDPPYIDNKFLLNLEIIKKIKTILKNILLLFIGKKILMMILKIL